MKVVLYPDITDRAPFMNDIIANHSEFPCATTMSIFVLRTKTRSSLMSLIASL